MMHLLDCIDMVMNADTSMRTNGKVTSMQLYDHNHCTVGNIHSLIFYFTIPKYV